MFGSCLKKNAYNKFPGFTALRQRFAAAVIALGLILAVSGVQAEADPPLAPPQEDSSVYQMESVVVTGSRTPTDAPEKMAVPVQVITSKQLQEIGAVSLDQALEVMQEVELIQSPDMNAAPGVQTLRMRGMDANHVLILINGRRQPGTRPDNQGVGFTDISSINISDIERIEVLRDGASAQYGSDAVAGVINIVMRKYNPRFSANGQYGISSRGDAEEKKLEVSGGIPVGEKLFVNASANGRRSDHYDRTPNTPRWNAPDVEQGGAGFKCSLEIEPGQILDAELRYSQTETVIRIGQTGPVNKDRISEKKDYFGGLTYEGDFAPYRFEAGVSEGWSDTEYDHSEEPDYEGDLESDIRDAYAHMNWDYRPWLNLFVGTSFNREAIDAPYRDFVESRNIFALFAETRITFFERLSVQLSGRLEEYSDFGTNFAPKISTRYEWLDNLALRASVSRSFQVPTLYQLHDRFIDAMGWNDIYGNPDLDPSEGVSLNAGIVWTPFGTGGPILSVDCYRNDIRDLIEVEVIKEKTPTTNAETTYKNLEGTSTFMGVEVAAGLPLPHGFRLDVTANYLDAKDPDDEDLTNRPRSRLNAILGYRFGERLTANLRYVYRGKYLSDTKPHEKIDDFDYINAQVTYALTSSISIYIGGRNLLDEAPPVDLEKYEGGHMESMLDSPLGAFYYGGVRLTL
jgi:outer membrane receptor for ferrienterochelin and colicin